MPVAPTWWPDGAERTLWDAQLFPVLPSRAAATAWALACLVSVQRTGTWGAGASVSVAAALAAKDVARDLADRAAHRAALAAAVLLT